MGAAAATVLAAGGVAIAASIGPAQGSGTFSSLNAIGGIRHAADARQPGRQHTPFALVSGASRRGKAGQPRSASGARAASGLLASHQPTPAAQATPAAQPTPAAQATSAKNSAKAGNSASAGNSAKAGQAAPAKQAAPHKPALRPYLIYDSVTPSAIPAHHAVATYATGSYAVSPAQVAGRRTVLWIDTTGTDPRASILDVEPGDATPSMAAIWARNRLTAYPGALARIYTMRSEWPAVKAAIATLPATMRSRIRYWIADPTGVPHLVPGSAATQWYWGSSYDISTATPGF